MAAACVLVVFCWDFLRVRYEFGGNWTGLFCTGSKFAVPPQLGSERIHTLPESAGWDGQFYHYIAHDPLAREGLSRFVDAPTLRYRRILLPGLAHLLALGQPRFIDAAYIAASLGFVFLGAFWLARYMTLHGIHAAWGAAFAVVPGVLAAIDRMSVDAALAALLAGAVVYAGEGSPRRLYLVLTLGSLARETGLCLVAAYCLSLLFAREFRRAGLFLTASFPTLAWYAFVRLRLGACQLDGAVAFPLAGFLDRVMHPMPYALTGAARWLVVSLDYVALAGIFAGFVLAARVAAQWPYDFRKWAVLLLAMVGLVLWRPGDWLEAYDYGRILSPLLLLLMLLGISQRRWPMLLPMLLVLPRFGLEMGLHARAILRGPFSA